MTPEKNAVLRDDERVTRLYPARPRPRGEAASRGVAQSGIGVDGPGYVLSSELRSRLGQSVEQRLLEPLHQIGTMADVLKGDPSARHVDQLAEICDASHRAEGMLRDVLDFMRVSAGGLTLERRQVDLKLLCERVVDAIHTRHPDRPMLFTSATHVQGCWDPDRMAALLTALVVNAIDHGPPRPAIRIELDELPDSATLRVWNGGRVLLGEPSRAFEPFVTGLPRAGGTKGGLGLGLYLAREIARAHGGSIDLQSTEDHGTTLRVVVPRA